MLMLVMTACSWGQSLDAPWVKQAQQRVEAARKTDVRVIVLNRRGEPVPGARVRLAMQRHAFAFGVRLNPSDFADGQQPPAARDASAVWRCFNAASLDAATAWAVTQPHPGQWDFLTIDDMIAWADGRGMTLRWGSLTSADPARVPGWVIGRHNESLQDALEDHIRTVMVRFGHRVDQFDVHTDQLDHKLVADRLGWAMVRRLHEYAQAAAPEARTCLRFENALSGDRLNTMIQEVARMREAFVPFDLVAVDQQWSGMILQGPLQRGVESVGKLGHGVVVTNLEVGGPTPAAAAINLETVLRTLLAEPAIKGIWFAGATAGELTDPSAALVDADGQPTPAGQVLDGLVRRAWWTDEQHTTDELGNVRARVYAGVYQLHADTPDGPASTTIYLPVTPAPRIVLLSPLSTLEPVGD